MASDLPDAALVEPSGLLRLLMLLRLATDEAGVLGGTAAGIGDEPAALPSLGPLAPSALGDASW